MIEAGRLFRLLVVTALGLAISGLGLVSLCFQSGMSTGVAALFVLGMAFGLALGALQLAWAYFHWPRPPGAPCSETSRTSVPPGGPVIQGGGSALPDSEPMKWE